MPTGYHIEVRSVTRCEDPKAAWCNYYSVPFGENYKAFSARRYFTKHWKMNKILWWDGVEGHQATKINSLSLFLLKGEEKNSRKCLESEPTSTKRAVSTMRSICIMVKHSCICASWSPHRKRRQQQRGGEDSTKGGPLNFCPRQFALSAGWVMWVQRIDFESWCSLCGQLVTVLPCKPMTE